MLRTAAAEAFDRAKTARLAETREKESLLFDEWASRMGMAGMERRIYSERPEGPASQLRFKILCMVTVDDLEFRGAYVTGDSALTMTLEGFHGGQIHSLGDLGAALQPATR
jgi:hypothetical protein